MYHKGGDMCLSHSFLRRVKSHHAGGTAPFLISISARGHTHGGVPLIFLSIMQTIAAEPKQLPEALHALRKQLLVPICISWCQLSCLLAVY